MNNYTYTYYYYYYLIMINLEVLGYILKFTLLSEELFNNKVSVQCLIVSSDTLADASHLSIKPTSQSEDTFSVCSTNDHLNVNNQNSYII
ncbi:hypothetical protein KSF78_0000185 [Schistosoma japonicum]|nr:hypothetical protein KSF78_0000185 [Schistosoma japonicum]